MNESNPMKNCLRPVMRCKRDRARSGRIKWDTIMTIIALLVFFLGLFWILNISTPAHAQVVQPAYTEAQAVRAIIGEASNQGYEGMLAVACAIRNRGTLRGVYGLKAKHVDQQPDWVWARARKAWKESAERDITGGADHWENIRAFGTPKWAEKMIRTVQVKDHVFYRS